MLGALAEADQGDVRPFPRRHCCDVLSLDLACDHLVPESGDDRCDVRFACHGGCPKDRFIETPAGDPGLNYLCAGSKDFFHHVDPAMRFMAMQLRDDRAPAEITTLYAAEDARRGRNDLCSCGSGRKWKLCHGGVAQQPHAAL